MAKRIKYSLYKKSYNSLPTVPGSYDPSTKTIEIEFPDEKPVKFGKEWIATGGNAKRLDGYRILIRFWNQGPAQSYMVEAIRDPYKYNALPVQEYIPGTGNAAKAAAIKRALELRDTGKYNY